MDTIQLKSFIAIARTLNFTEAANRSNRLENSNKGLPSDKKVILTLI